MDDLISRQAAIGEVKKHYRAYDNDLLELITFDIERLPPAQPEAPCYLGSPCEYQNPNAEIQKERTDTHACD